MSRASKLSHQIMAVLQEKGEAVETGPEFIEVLAAAKKRKDKKGRPVEGSRLVLVKKKSKSPVIKIREKGKADKTTGVIIRPGMDPVEAQLAAEVIHMDHRKDARRRLLGEVSDADVALKQIVDDWIVAHACEASEQTNTQRKRDAGHLEKGFACQRLGDVRYGSGLAYISYCIKGVEDEDKVRSLFNSAVSRLRMLRKAIDDFYCNLSEEPEFARYFYIPDKKKYRSELYMTADQLMRLLKAAQGWKYDPETGQWTEDPDPDLLVVERYILIYFYSGTRNATILPLQWGINLEGGSIDAKAGIIYRSAPGADETNKRAEPAHLLGTLRQKVVEWEEADLQQGWSHVLHDTEGNEISSIKRRFNKVREKADLEWVSGHTCKHTGVTLMSHAGLDINTLAVSMCTTSWTLQNEYKHLHFLWLRPRTTVSVDVGLDLESLAKSSPPSNDAWKAKAARIAAARAAAAKS
jgi:integrase